MPPLLGTILRFGGGGHLKDNFNRTLTGSLGSTSQGNSPWSILTGVWNVNGTKPTSSTSQSSNPLAVVDPKVSDIDASLTLGAGDALYFRVSNSTNWWRLLWEGWQTSSCQTCCNTCCSTCYESCQKQNRVCSGGGCSSCNTGGCGCTCPSGQGCNFTLCHIQCNPYSCNCSSCNCSSCNCTYFNNYRLLTQKMVGGSLSTIHTGSTVSTATTVARIVTKGSIITSYRDATQMYTGTQADHATQTKFGIGRGVSSYNTSAIDDFDLSWK